MERESKRIRINNEEIPPVTDYIGECFLKISSVIYLIVLTLLITHLKRK